jgi:uncharacterized membrane protein
MTSLLASLSAIAVGLTSGLYWAFAVAVMPGLRDVDDRAFVTIMRAINRRILNAWFLPVFFGGLLLPIATALAVLAGDHAGAKRWGLAGAVLAAIPFAITAGGNVPLNDALETAGNDDPAAARRAFEGPWTRLNRRRSLTSIVALAALVRLLLLLR